MKTDRYSMCPGQPAGIGKWKMGEKQKI